MDAHGRWRAGRALRLLGVVLPVAGAAGWLAVMAFGAGGEGLRQWVGRAVPVLFAVLTVGLLVLLGRIVSRHHRRRLALRRLAAEHGWKHATPGAGLPLRRSRSGRHGARLPTDRWSWAPFVGRNDGTVGDLVTGEFGRRRFAEFTYSYADRGLGGSRPSLIGVTVVRLPVELPRLQVSPEGIAAALVPGLRWLDVDVESEAFNRRYRVQAQDRRYAVDVLNQRAVLALLSVEPFTLRIDGSDLIGFGPAATDRAEILRRLEVVGTIADCIPAFVLKDRGRRA